MTDRDRGCIERLAEQIYAEAAGRGKDISRDVALRKARRFFQQERTRRGERRFSE